MARTREELLFLQKAFADIRFFMEVSMQLDHACLLHLFKKLNIERYSAGQKIFSQGKKKNVFQNPSFFKVRLAQSSMSLSRAQPLFLSKKMALFTLKKERNMIILAQQQKEMKDSPNISTEKLLMKLKRRKLNAIIQTVGSSELSLKAIPLVKSVFKKLEAEQELLLLFVKKKHLLEH